MTEQIVNVSRQRTAPDEQFDAYAPDTTAPPLPSRVSKHEPTGAPAPRPTDAATPETLDTTTPETTGGPEPELAEPLSVGAAWSEYLAAAQQLDSVRRGAADAAGRQAQAVQNARMELTAVRARLAPQQSRLRELGIPAMTLVPSPPEVAAATRAMAGGPDAVLVALVGARGSADAAEAALSGSVRWPAWLRNLLVYGPLALLVPTIQVVLFVAFGAGPLSVVALLLGLPAPAVAFAAGWTLLGRLVRSDPGPLPDRTPLFGIVVCLVPAVLALLGVGTATLLG